MVFHHCSWLKPASETVFPWRYWLCCANAGLHSSALKALYANTSFTHSYRSFFLSSGTSALQTNLGLVSCPRVPDTQTGAARDRTTDLVDDRLLSCSHHKPGSSELLTECWCYSCTVSRAALRFALWTQPNVLCSVRAQRLTFNNVIIFAPLFPPDSSALYFIYEALITGSHHSEVITVCVSNSCSPDASS